MFLVYLFVCFVRVSFCHFSLPLDVGGWLRFVIVALPGLFYYHFFYFVRYTFYSCHQAMFVTNELEYKLEVCKY